MMFLPWWWPAQRSRHSRGHQRHDQVGHRFGQLRCVARPSRGAPCGHRPDLAASLAAPSPPFTGDQHVTSRADLGRGHALAVASERRALSCSAIRRTAIRSLLLRFQLVDQLGDILDLFAAWRARRLGVDDGQARRDVDADNRPGSFSSSGFFLAFMMFGSEA
jgi:hypothetical protein